jgi:outer membrane protein OmpA-like peptidoglycan-associated protein
MSKRPYYVEYHSYKNGGHLFRLYNFDIGKWSFQTDHRYALQEFVLRFLRANPVHTVSLLGLASSTGTERFNMRLSKMRALAVQSYLLGGVLP